MAVRLFLHAAFILLALSFSAAAQPYPTTITVESLRNPSLVGQAVTFRATLSASGGGTVTFKSGGTVLGEVTSFGTTFPPDVVMFTTSSLSEGRHSITAEFSGNVYGELPSTSDPITQDVNPMGTTPSTTTVTSSKNPSKFGESVTFTARVTGAGGTPGGEVVFRRDGVPLSAAQPLVDGETSFTYPALSVGENRITAHYDGNAAYAPSNSTSLAQIVNRGETTTQLTSSRNPSLEGESVTFTAVVSNPTFIPGGTVTFKDGVTPLATVSLQGGIFGNSDQAVLTIDTLAIGTHTITAEYSGDSNFEPSTSNSVFQLVNRVGIGPTTTTATSSPNPSTYGEAVTLTATITSPNGTPGGEVEFREGSTLLGSAAVVSGVATLTQSFLSVGDHGIIARYTGDIDFAASDSALFTHTVHHGITTTTLTSSPNPSVAGQTVTLTATVASGSNYPSGTVTFKDGATTLGSSEIEVSTFCPGSARFTTSTLTPGRHTLTAEYAGDASFAPSSSAAIIHQRTDPNGDGEINIVDVFYIVNRIFHGRGAPAGEQAMDANGDGTLNAADIIYLLNYLF